MHVIKVRNVHEALPEGIALLLTTGVRRDSRNGEVLEIQSPVATVYERPQERHLFHPGRNDNPFFHLLESVWMLAGENKVAPLAQIVKRMNSFSDDGETLHGAYGHRWRKNFLFDQLESIIVNLKRDNLCRRQVLQMWDCYVDLKRAPSSKDLPIITEYFQDYGKSKDIPCNLLATFKIDSNGKLRMTVMCRSNDIIWGAYGANSYHFSMLHEYAARGIGVEIGEYTQISDSFHAYTKVLDTMPSVEKMRKTPYPFDKLINSHYPIRSTSSKLWLKDAQAFMSLWTNYQPIGYRDGFFRRVARPVLEAHRAFQDKEDPRRFNAARTILNDCANEEVRKACQNWLDKREVAKK